MNASQVRQEQADDPVDKMRRLMEKWENRLTLDNLRLGERYLKGEIQLNVHLCVPGSAADARDFCAVFRYADITGRVTKQVGIGASRLVDRCPADADPEPFQPQARHEQEFVLVENVQLMDRPEVIVPSWVWFGLVDEYYRTRSDSLFSSTRVGSVFGKSFIKGVLMAPHDDSSVRLNEPAGEVIKGRMQVVYGVPDDAREAGGDLPVTLEPNDMCARLRIYIGHDSIRAGFAEGFDRACHITDVVFGPFDFLPNEV